MLRKLSIAIAGSMLLAGTAAAAPLFAIQPSSTFPSSSNETGPNYPAPTLEGARSQARTTAGFREVQTPSSVNETMPEMTGDQTHPTMGSGATRATGPSRNVPYPSSVNETMPEMSGGQSHPTMGR